METPVNAPLKVKFQLEIKKLREMSFKNKLEYIWEYYKIHIVALLIVLFIIGSLINTWLINPTPETALFISWNAGYATEEQLTELSEVLQLQIVNEGANEVVAIDRIFMNDDDSQMALASISQLVAMVSAGVIDIFILDSALLENYSLSAFIQPMDDILAEVKQENPIAYDRIKSEVKYADFSLEEDNVAERLMGIGIGNTPLLMDLGFHEQELYFATSITAGNADNIVRAIMVFFD